MFHVKHYGVINMKNIIIIVLSILLLYSRFEPQFDYGFCMDNNGNGIILDYETKLPIDPYYNYIKYDNGLCGKYILTFYLLNPFTNWDDDIVFRYDFIMG